MIPDPLLIPKNLLFQFGGGGGTPPAPPPPTPPVTERQTDVLSAQRQQRVDAQRRNGQLASLFAGTTSQEGQVKQRTLLGGG